MSKLVRTLPPVDVNEVGKCYYMQDSIGMQKRLPHDVFTRQWFQLCIVDIVMSLPHDTLMGDQLGVNKTCNRILSLFYWHKVRKDIFEFCRLCHVCQMAEVNQFGRYHLPLYNQFQLLKNRLVECWWSVYDLC